MATSTKARNMLDSIALCRCCGEFRRIDAVACSKRGCPNAESVATGEDVESVDPALPGGTAAREAPSSGFGPGRAIAALVINYLIIRLVFATVVGVCASVASSSIALFVGIIIVGALLFFFWKATGTSPGRWILGYRPCDTAARRR